MRRKSNQRITKIKKDRIEELLKQAEKTAVENAVSIQPIGSDLTPYPDLNNLRLWTRDYLLKGMNKTYPVKLDTDGQTYLTTLIDGLPLFTKMSKTIKAGSYEVSSYRLSDIITELGDVTFDTETGVASGFASNKLLNIDSNLFYQSNNTIVFKFTTPSTTVSGWNRVFSSGWFDALAFDGSNNFVYWSNSSNAIITLWAGALNTTYWFKLVFGSSNTISMYYSTNGTTWTTIQENRTETRANTSTPTIGANAAGNDVWTGTIDLSESYLQLSGASPIYFAQLKTDTIDVPMETSKPGLWLSNLTSQVSNSSAGSWLRSNLINDNLDSFRVVNSDTIGNYTFSYYQRGIIHRTAGSSHDNADSYCQHWSPSALGCISHDAIIIPENNLRSTYTSYQTPVVPVDPDMQVYEETMSKDVEFTFVDNNNNIPLSTTQFNGRVVGDGWTYELTFRPNYKGSGNEYGVTEEDVPNGSNGGCVTGTLVYQDSDLGTVCTQEVNSCFSTTQSHFNPDVPELPEGAIIGREGTYEYISSTNQVQRYNVAQGNFTIAKNCSSDSSIFECMPNINSTGVMIFACARSIYGYCSQEARPIYDGELSGPVTAIKANGKFTRDLTTYTTSGGSIYYTGIKSNTESYTGVTLTLIHENEPLDDPDYGVNLYLNVKDLRKQYESEGLPWTGGCGANRFDIEISTTQCTESYCKSFIIAENVDINSLGDISELEQKVWSNAVTTT